MSILQLWIALALTISCQAPAVTMEPPYLLCSPFHGSSVGGRGADNSWFPQRRKQELIIKDKTFGLM